MLFDLQEDLGQSKSYLANIQPYFNPNSVVLRTNPVLFTIIQQYLEPDQKTWFAGPIWKANEAIFNRPGVAGAIL